MRQKFLLIILMNVMNLMKNYSDREKMNITMELVDTIIQLNPAC